MSVIRKFLGVTAALAVTAACSSAWGADHLDSPSVEADGRLDINDLYVFQSPTNPENTVFVVTVNPAAGVISPTSFNTAGVYEINLDYDLDAVADLTFAVTFESAGGSAQTFTVQRSDQGSPLVEGAAGTNLAIASGGRVRADVFDDPFFFDLNGFEAGLAFTGTDFFAGFFTSAIVLEVPTSSLGATKFGVWARTTIDGAQFDRMGRPAITTALLPDDPTKNAFNVANPVNDFAEFGDEVAATITSLNGGNSDLAGDLACILLPDLLTIDTSVASGFPNGRRLQDDVIDVELTLLSNGGLTTDSVDSNDKAFPGEFPYLAATGELYIDRRPLADDLRFYIYAAYASCYNAYLANQNSVFAYYAALYAQYAYQYELEAEKVAVLYFADDDLANYANLRYASLAFDFYAYVVVYYYVYLQTNGTAPSSLEATQNAYIAYLVQLNDLQDLTDNGEGG